MFSPSPLVSYFQNLASSGNQQAAQPAEITPLNSTPASPVHAEITEIPNPQDTSQSIANPFDSKAAAIRNGMTFEQYLSTPAGKAELESRAKAVPDETQLKSFQDMLKAANAPAGNSMTTTPVQGTPVQTLMSGDPAAILGSMDAKTLAETTKAMNEATASDFNVRANAADLKFKFAKLDRSGGPGSVLNAEKLQPEEIKAAQNVDRSVEPFFESSNRVLQQLQNGVPPVGAGREKFLQSVSDMTYNMKNMMSKSTRFSETEQKILGEMEGNPTGWLTRIDPQEAANRIKIMQKATLRNVQNAYPSGFNVNNDALKKAIGDRTYNSLVPNPKSAQGQVTSAATSGNGMISVYVTDPKGNTKISQIHSSQLTNAQIAAQGQGWHVQEVK